MPSAREDYLLRLIQQLGGALARLRERLSGPRASLEADDIAREADTEIVRLLGPQALLLQQLDPTSAVRIVADPQRVAFWVAFLRVQAEAHRQGGRVDAAQRAEVRAAAIEQAAKALWSEVPNA
jgi:hypothetical protein